MDAGCEGFATPKAELYDKFRLSIELFKSQAETHACAAAADKIDRSVTTD